MQAMKDQSLARLNFLNQEQGKIAREMDKISIGYDQPKSGMEDQYQQLKSEYDAIVQEKMSMNHAVVQGDAYDSYRALAGEAEARLVQDRMNMSMDERLANPFYKNYDVPLEDQIVRFGDGESLSLPMEEASSGDIIDAIVRTADDPDLPDTGYRGGHTAPVDPEYHAPLHEMNLTYPDDIYSPQAARYYGHGNTYLDAPSFNVINRVRGKPDADVTMYRAVPLDATNEILPGDWVTTNQRYAKEHGEGLEKYKILKGKTKAKKLRTDGNSPHEYGYTGARLLPIPAGLLGLSIMEDNESY